MLKLMQSYLSRRCLRQLELGTQHGLHFSSGCACHPVGLLHTQASVEITSSGHLPSPLSMAL